MVFNATFNNISVTSIPWWSVLLVEETGSTWRKPATCRKSLTQTLSHNVVSSSPRHKRDLKSQR